MYIYQRISPSDREVNASENFIHSNNRSVELFIFRAMASINRVSDFFEYKKLTKFEMGDKTEK